MPAISVVTVVSMVGALLGTVPAVAAPPHPAPPPPTSHGHAVSGATPVTPHFPKPADNPAKHTFTPTATSWPAAATGAKEGAKAHGAKTPAWAQAIADGKGGYTGPTTIGVRVLDHAAATAAGVDGVLLAVTPSSSAGGGVRVGVDYGAFAQAYGGNYAGRLRLVALPACALTTPKVAACRTQTPLPSTNDLAGKSVSAKVTLGAPTATPAHTGGAAAPATASTATASSPMVVAATSSSDPGQEGGSGGSYAATTLSPSGSWTAGGSTGSFTYSYPITVPPAASSLTPKVALSYDSGAVDGKTASTQAQASWVGDGWSTPQSYIEQSFVSCKDNPEGSAAPASTSDSCYNGPVLTLSLNGSSTALVWDASKQVWKPQNDDGAVITHVTNSGNGTGTYNTDYWTVTTRDGTTFQFGRNQLPGWVSGKPTTNSVDYVPVYSAHPKDQLHPDEPCYSSAGFASSVCTMAYRWNLDYVKDIHGNAMSYYYKQDTNSYGEYNGTKNASYVRDSHLDHIDYGFTDGNAYGTVADKVVFNTGDRCVTGTCQPLNATNKANWPDVPYDLICPSDTNGTNGAVCPSYGPSFFSTVRLTSIATEQYSTATSNYVTVDSYALAQTIPSVATGDTTSPTLWLASIQRTGSGTPTGASTTPVTLPTVSFTGNQFQNRTDTSSGQPVFSRYRITGITTETGSTIAVTYQLANPCATPVSVNPAANTSSCFPVYWTPQDYAQPFLDWFNKYVVTQVTATDPTGGAPATAASYTYNGGAAWHYDDNEVVQPKYRTYGQFRGYGDVQTRTGDASLGPQTLSETTYYRGMSNDNNTTAVTLTDSAGGHHDDTNQLAGSALETTAYLGSGGPVDHSTVTSYWISPATATRSRTGLPALTANTVAQAETYTRQALTAGGTTSWRYTETDNSYDANTASATFGLLTRTYTHTVPASSSFDRCTTTSYAPTNTTYNLVGLVAETETDSVACGGFTEGSPASVPAGLNTLTAPASVTRPDQVVSDTRTFYDDPKFATTFPQPAAPTKGDVTMTQAATSWASGAFSYQTTKQASYDTIGRVTATFDGRGYKTATSYTMNSVGLTTGASVTNPLGQAASTTLDPQRGLTLTTKDPNGITTTQQYDALGRVTAVWLHNRTTAQAANYTYAYQVANTGVTAVTTKKINDASGYITSTLIYDAQLRPRQTQTDTEQSGRMVTDTFYDSHGWAASKYTDWWDATTTPTTTPNATLVSPTGKAIKVINGDVYTYDGLGRVVQDASTRNNQTVSTTTTVYNGDRTTVIPPTGGVAKTTLTDPLGRTSELDSYTSAPTVTVPANTFTGIWTVTGGTTTPIRYGFDGHGQQNTVTDAANNTWTQTFNLLGQVTAKTDPDAGTVTSGVRSASATMTYDGNGNLTQVTDARNKTISFTYDALNRKTGEYDAATSAQTDTNQIAAWVYDNSDNAVSGMTNPIGHLTAAKAYWGNAAYTTQYNNFNVFGESLGETITIPSTENSLLAGTYTYSHIYTATSGLLLKSILPNKGGLPGETLIYNYTSMDQPNTLGGLTNYTAKTYYDEYNRVKQETLGGSPNQANILNTYDDHTGWLTDQLVQRTVTPINVDEQKYAYDLAGNITKQFSTRSGASTPTETQCYTYDALDRLTQAWTATDSCTATPTTTNHSTVGDSLGASSSYWTSWSFDALGNRTNQTQHNLTSGADTTTSYTYNGNGTNQAHTLTSTSTTGATTASTSYRYDTAGNTTTRTTPAQGTQTLTWNDANQLTAVTGSKAGNTSYKYDADGNLLLQYDPGKTTLYLPGEQITLNTATNTTTGVRYYQLPGGGLAIRTGSGNAFNFALTDQHGTPTVYLDYTAQTPTWRQYTPYGDTRGATTTWPDNRGFLNKPVNSTTGLNEIGARNYDPTTGRFISLDPVFESANSQQLNGYSYAAASPTTQSDPTGLDPCPHGGGGCGYDDTPSDTQTPPWIDYYTGSLTDSEQPSAPSKAPDDAGTWMDYYWSDVTPPTTGKYSPKYGYRVTDKTLFAGGSVYDKNGNLIASDDTFRSGGGLLPGEDNQSAQHVEPRIIDWFSKIGVLDEGSTLVIAVNAEDTPPCSSCSPLLKRVAESKGIRIIYISPGERPQVFGEANSSALLEGVPVLSRVPAKLKPGTIPDGHAGSESGNGKGAGVTEPGGVEPGRVGRVGGAAGEILGPLGMLSDIYSYYKYGPCGMGYPLPGNVCYQPPMA